VLVPPHEGRLEQPLAIPGDQGIDRPERRTLEDREAQPGRACRRMEAHASAPLGQAVADPGDGLDRLVERLLPAAVRPVDLGHGVGGSIAGGGRRELPAQVADGDPDRVAERVGLLVPDVFLGAAPASAPGRGGA
jgi:hypothetical protein